MALCYDTRTDHDDFWPGTDTVNDWLGDFIFTGPLSAQYDSVSFEPVTGPIRIICRLPFTNDRLSQPA